MTQAPAAPPESEDETLVCFCHCVPKKDIIAAILKGADSVYAIQQETLASTGCGGCEAEVLDLLERYAKPGAKKS